MLQSVLRRAVAFRPASTCTSSGIFSRFETTDAAVVRRAEENEGNVITIEGAAFPGDLRSTSGLGLGDGLESHTDKWLQGTPEGSNKSPMEWVHEQEPIKVHGLTVASFGSDDPALGAPVEYIDLRGTTREHPATCKYTGNQYYSLDWQTPSKSAH